MTLILASLSEARRKMLEAAQVPFDSMAAGVDEETAKQSLRGDGLSARDLADALAELKAVRISTRRPGDIVLGCDQTLVLHDGAMLDKPGTNLASQLRLMSGQTHTLYSAVVAAENGQPIWRAVDRVKMTVRHLSDAFILEYVASEGEFVGGCLGGYRIEGVGAQLFSKIEGSHFTVLGLPLFQLLEWLRSRGVLPS